jgi:hypothetical protein
MKTVMLKEYTGVIHAGHHAVFEHNEFGEDDGVKIYLKGKVITDYEYCYEIPEEVMTYMTSEGYSFT